NLQVTATFNQVVVDADQRAPVDVAAASTSSVQVQTAGALAIQIRAPQLVEGFRSQLTVDISNTGGAEIAGLGLGALDLTDASGAAVTPTAISAVPAGPLAGGARASFTFDVTPAPGAGTLTVHAGVTGTETNTTAQRIGDATTRPLAALRERIRHGAGRGRGDRVSLYGKSDVAGAGAIDRHVYDGSRARERRADAPTHVRGAEHGPGRCNERLACRAGDRRGNDRELG